MNDTVKQSREDERREESLTVDLANHPPVDTSLVYAFLRARDFREDEYRVRALLLDFVKFCAEPLRKAA